MSEGRTTRPPASTRTKPCIWPESPMARTSGPATWAWARTARIDWNAASRQFSGRCSAHSGRSIRISSCGAVTAATTWPREFTRTARVPPVPTSTPIQYIWFSGLARSRGAGDVQRHQDQNSIDFAEPVRSVFRNDHEVPLGDGARHSALNALALKIVAIARFLGELAAGGQGGGAVDHVEQFGFLFVHGRGSHRGPIFQVRVVGSELKDAIGDDRLVVLAVRLCFGDHGRDVGRRGIELDGRSGGRLLRQAESGEKQ